MNVLYVDDNELNRNLLGSMFETRALEVRLAADAFEGERMVLERAPDFLFVDYNMPGRNGLELIERLRAHPDVDPKLPICMVTAETALKESGEAFRRGADGIVLKPVAMRELFSFIEAFGRGRRHRIGAPPSAENSYAWDMR